MITACVKIREVHKGTPFSADKESNF